MPNSFCIAGFVVHPDLGVIVSDRGAELHIEPRVMKVMELLASEAGEVVPKDEIVKRVWNGSFVTDDALVRCVSQLRKAFGDTSRQQSFIQTIPKRGYRLVPPVTKAHRPSARRPVRPTLDAVLQSCTDHVYVFDRAGRYIFVSAAGARALGLTPREMVGKTWRELSMPPEILEPFMCEVETTFDGGDSVVRQTSYPTIDGERHYEYLLDPVSAPDDSGEVVAVVAFVRDLTDRLRRGR